MKFITILISLFVAMLIIEGSLRIGGAYLKWQQFYEVAKEDRVGTFRILVVGESTSMKYWENDIETSWPTILQDKLNTDSYLNTRFKVFVMGEGGTSSFFLLKSLPLELARVKPHLVISMMGINDNGAMSFYNVGAKGWHSLRIVKAFKWAMAAYKERGIKRNFERYAPLPPDIYVKFDVNTCCRTPLEREAFPNMVENIIKTMNIEDGHNIRYRGAEIYRIAALSQGLTRDEEFKMMDWACPNIAAVLKLKPRVAFVAHSLAYCAHRERYRELVYPALLNAFKQGLKPTKAMLNTLGVIDYFKYDSSMTQLQEWEAGLTQEITTYEALGKNYRDFADLLKKEKVHYFAMTYPTAHLDSIRVFFAKNYKPQESLFISSLYRKHPPFDLLPEYEKIVFVSNENFNEVVNDGNSKEWFYDLFSAWAGGKFGHTTKKGHALIAENAFRAIVEKWEVLKDDFSSR